MIKPKRPGIVIQVLRWLFHGRGRMVLHAKKTTGLDGDVTTRS
jgi:hypothetical protein